MQIVSSTGRGSGFELDTGAVGLRSIDKSNVKLPYDGVLPNQMSSSESAYIYFNVTLTGGFSAYLAVDGGGGVKLKRPLNVSSREAIELLDRFFDQSVKSSGLSPYYGGLWKAHYVEWRKAVTGPDRLLVFLSTLSKQDRQFIQKHIMDDMSVE